MTRRALSAALAALAAGALPLAADPCGMVPPVVTTEGPPIERIGAQKTYVFFKDGVESFVIRPGYQGEVDEFGMLIPFPTPPAIRKVPDDVFPHVAAAVDPPEVVVSMIRFGRMARGRGGAPDLNGNAPERDLGVNEVEVLRQEAVGMYEVAVLAAGSAAALERWMDDHGYRYPDGMDEPCDDYVADGWCFVAVKTRVGVKGKVAPRPGMTEADPSMPAGATFDGHVQAMGFRFETDALVVPMRLSAFNAGETRNIVYLLADEPLKCSQLPADMVVRQVPGPDLLRNVEGPLPVLVVGGTADDVDDWDALAARRDPFPKNGHARDLFASDLLAAAEGRLSHPHEEREKALLEVAERLGLRGGDLDDLHREAQAEAQEAVAAAAFDDVSDMTLTVIDGEFPRDVLGSENLTFEAYTMDDEENDVAHYDAKAAGPPAHDWQRSYGGVRVWGTPPDATVEEVPPSRGRRGGRRGCGLADAGAGGSGWGPLLLLGAVLGAVRLRRRAAGAAAAGLVVAAGLALGAAPAAAEEASVEDLIDRLAEPEQARDALAKIVARGDEAVPHLIGEAFEGQDLLQRGWSIVGLAEIGGERARERLADLQGDAEQSDLVRTWAGAARIELAEDADELVAIARSVGELPALERPLGMRLTAELAAGGGEGLAEAMLRLTVQSPDLQGALGPALKGLDPAELVRVMVTVDDGPNGAIRRQAAGFLGAQAQEGDEATRAVAAAVIEAYRFDPAAEAAAWAGGPLFVPGISWSREEARALVGELISWLVWAEAHERPELKTQIHNNARSLSLARVAGYESPGWNEAGVERWLGIWGKTVGEAELTRLLKEQGAVARYQSVLDALPE